MFKIKGPVFPENYQSKLYSSQDIHIVELYCAHCVSWKEIFYNNYYQKCNSVLSWNNRVLERNQVMYLDISHAQQGWIFLFILNTDTFINAGY